MCPEPTRISPLGLLLDLQVVFTSTTSPDFNRLFYIHVDTARTIFIFLFLFFFAVAHQNGDLKNTNHLANQRNAHHHSQRHSSHGNATRPFLPSNINQQKQRGGSRPQPNLDCLKVPDQGAAGWGTGTDTGKAKRTQHTVCTRVDKILHTCR